MNPNSFCSFTLLLTFLITSWTVSATEVTVYTDRAEWEAAAQLLRPGPFYLEQNFDQLAPGYLSVGRNEFESTYPYGLFIVDVLASPGGINLNSIEDGTVNPGIAPTYSPNGSTFYLGEVSTSTQLQLLFQPFAAPPLSAAFGADWVIPDPGLTMEIGSTVIDFDTYLPGGSGFLGVIANEDDYNITPIMLSTANSFQLFGMDNIVSYATPIPSALYLFCSGLIGIGAMARQRRTRE